MVRILSVCTVANVLECVSAANVRKGGTPRSRYMDS
jgi:hypothetical protein